MKKEMIGKRFGRLVVIEEAERQNPKYVYYRCKCDCGNEKVLIGSNLRNGNCQSCGCYQIERTQTVNSQKIKHGQSRTRLYKVWGDMRIRCNCNRNPAYHRYGERGITVCEEWNTSFETFRDWALESGYKKGLSIERIDNDKGYNPDNCKWITMVEQSRNQTKTIRYQGTSLRNYCLTNNLPYEMVQYRMYKKGLSVDESVKQVTLKCKKE